jgi:hypothetical protein
MFGRMLSFFYTRAVGFDEHIPSICNIASLLKIVMLFLGFAIKNVYIAPKRKGAMVTSQSQPRHAEVRLSISWSWNDIRFLKLHLIIRQACLCTSSWHELDLLVDTFYLRA